MHRVTLIPGDGIGPEVSAAACRILNATGVKLDWEEVEAEPVTDRRGDRLLHAGWLDSIRRTRVALKGPMATPVAEGHRSLNVALRQALELYANLRPVRNLPGLKTRFDGVDVVIVRENTEDLYAGLEHTVVPGVVEGLKIVTERASTRIARFAFQYARANHRRTVCAIHKANIMKLSDGLFLNCVRRVAGEFPEINYQELIVDNACMQLVMKPEQFDLLLLQNLYGDIVSDLCAGLVGGLGVVPAANLGSEHAVFEAVHGTAPDIAGKNVANPTALALSGAMLLDHLGEAAAAQAVRQAIHALYREGRHLTSDVGGSASTTEFTDAVVAAVEAAASRRQVGA
ncbi:isocitrate/isopropylmalate family dehydrogenase [Acidobacteriia bacterium AH_259_A11_L15]|nr:isocitrate/isopropylmalate family dehydrogenase [Acidobacteriia bacterium AH_259_A11_L15]